MNYILPAQQIYLNKSRGLWRRGAGGIHLSVIIFLSRILASQRPMIADFSTLRIGW
jgi:hypothetical protein